MPPKGGDKAKKAADKAKQAAKAKVAEDKTFGLKNKNKSAKVQKFVQTVQENVNKNKPAATAPKDKKKAEEERQKELNALFAVAIKQPKVPAGVDPKSIVCEYFRHGQCTKGFKCKFSHDLSVERKVAKIDLFTDQRDAGKDGEDNEEGMDDWDQETLEKVVREKHGAEKPSNKTDIICKYFLDAVEKRQYGWFWKCPNGAECKYRHALPPGYILKSQMRELLEEEARNVKDVVEVIEEERAKINAVTPMTEQVFKEWHRQRNADKLRTAAEREAERKRKGVLNGREIFMQEGFEAADDASAADDYQREEDDEAKIRSMMQEAEDNAAAARQREAAEAAASSAAAPNGHAPSSSNPTATANGEDDAGPSTSTAATHLKLDEADEDLFDDDDSDDDDALDDLEEQIKEAHLADS